MTVTLDQDGRHVTVRDWKLDSTTAKCRHFGTVDKADEFVAKFIIEMAKDGYKVTQEDICAWRFTKRQVRRP